MYYIGIDLGGTNIAVGIVDSKGNIIKKASVPTPAQSEYQEIVKTMVDVSKNLVLECSINLLDIEAVGIGSPGTIDHKNRVVTYSNNINFKNAPIGEEFKKHWDIPVLLENDANAAAYGEYIVNGNDAEAFLAVTLGTGVGGGIVIDGKIFRGFNGAGAELGHTVLVYGGEPCSCGKLGCWESYASATALIKQTKSAIEKHPESLMTKFVEKYGKVNGRVAFDAAKEGDKVALEVVEQYIRYVAEGVLNMVTIFQPNKIVIGGGISNEGEYLLEPIRKYVYEHDNNKYFEKTKIETATLLNDAGIIGAALAAKNLR